MRRALNSPFPLVPLRDRWGYLKQGSNMGGRVPVLPIACRGMTRAAVRDLARLHRERSEERRVGKECSYAW